MLRTELAKSPKEGMNKIRKASRVSFSFFREIIVIISCLK